MLFCLKITWTTLWTTYVKTIIYRFFTLPVQWVQHLLEWNSIFVTLVEIPSNFWCTMKLLSESQNADFQSALYCEIPNRKYSQTAHQLHTVGWQQRCFPKRAITLLQPFLSLSLLSFTGSEKEIDQDRWSRNKQGFLKFSAGVACRLNIVGMDPSSRYQVVSVDQNTVCELGLTEAWPKDTFV